MKVTCWYNNGSLDTFRQFCKQNQNKPISLKLTNRSCPVKGALHSYSLDSLEAAGIFLLLTDRVIHPAYYSLDGIESVHTNEAQLTWGGMCPIKMDSALRLSPNFAERCSLPPSSVENL
jgi:hypothetical protein